MYRIRFHGRGGQGMKTASRILGSAFFAEGYEVQDAPRYGAERRGAPILAYVRAARVPINERGIINRPDLVVVAVDTLVPVPAAGVLAGISDRSVLLINTRESAATWQQRLNIGSPVITLPASADVEDRAELPYIGATCAGPPLRLMLEAYGWRSTILASSLVTFAIAAAIWLLVRDHPHEKGLPDFQDEAVLEKQIADDPRSGLSLVLSNRILWSVALVYFCFVYVQFGCLVWIPSFLKDTYALSVDSAGTISALVLLPGILASPLAGHLSDHWFHGRRRPLILLGLLALSGVMLLLSMRVGLTPVYFLLSLLGVLIVMPDILLAAYPSDILSRKLSATGTGFLTTFTSAAGIVATPVSGKIIDHFHSYNAVFISFAVMAFLAALMTFFIREKNS